MILDEFIYIKINGRQKKYYTELGYNINFKDLNLIKVKDLNKGSHEYINVKCDFCNNETKTQYRRVINKEKYCCNKCLSKNKEKCKEKYGYENVFNDPLIREKIKSTNLEKYSSEYPNQSEKIKNKRVKTNINKYGVDNVFKLDDVKNKIIETNIKKYGTEFANQNKNVKEKIKSSNLEKYGVNNYSKSEESKINTVIGQHPNYIKYIDNSISLFKCDLNNEHNFEIHIDNFHSRTKQNIPLCIICYPIGDQKSIKEKIILEYIQSIYSGEIISGYRDGIEIDIFLPELKLGIEFNGLYWHSNKFKESNYHLNKLNWFKERQIDIKFIYEDNFNNNLTIIKSQISNWLGKTETKIYARKCDVKEITNDQEEYKDFLNQNHIQGYVASKLVYGLYYQDNLVSLMCFDKKEGRLNMPENEWNLNRFCNLLNNNVIGGASKLLNHFIKINNPKRIISYADKDWSSGNLYFTLGFKLVSESKPDYKYIVDNIRKSKQNFTKAKLEKLGHDISLTESQIMNNLNINKIYDCGKMKFEKKLGL